uniref:Uncharacterized protein n=1 Tax=Peronospora matthiolae TaxID=2874970 RepID=A0AAV1VD43_9STRA
MTKITLALNQTRPSLTKPALLRLTTLPTLLAFRDPVRNLDTAEADQASPAPADHLVDPVGFSVGSDDAPADDASSADSDVGSDQVHDVDTTEVDQLAKECEAIRRAVVESEQRVAPLRIGFDALARSFAQRGRELDQLRRKRALSHQELHRLRSSHAAHVEELALLRAERDQLSRDHQAQLNNLVNFVMELRSSVGLAYDKRRREQSAADPVPPPNKRARVTVTSSSVGPDSSASPSSTVAGPASPTTHSRSVSTHPKSRQASRPRLDVPKI